MLYLTTYMNEICIEKCKNFSKNNSYNANQGLGVVKGLESSRARSRQELGVVKGSGSSRARSRHQVGPIADRLSVIITHFFQLLFKLRNTTD